MPAPCGYVPPFRRNVPSLFIVWIAGCDELLNVTWIGVYSFRGQLLERAGFVKPFGMQQFFRFMAERLAEIGFVQCPHLRVVLGSSLISETFSVIVDVVLDT